MSRRFLFTYRYQGAEWSLVLHASDPRDAMNRLSVLASARYDGEVFHEMKSGLMARLVVWWKNQGDAHAP